MYRYAFKISFGVVMTFALCVCVLISMAVMCTVGCIAYALYAVLSCVLGLAALISGVLPWMLGLLQR